ncbi:MAG: 50S ribosomal protein L10 [Acidobacteriota bacterium]
MNRAEKQEVIKELNETFKGNNSVMLVNFTGLNVADATHLRGKISEADCGYRVVKNRLALRAIEDTSLGELKEHFQGPTAIAYTAGDPVALAKVLKSFIEDHPDMSFKAGVVEGQAVSAVEMDNLAEMPSRPQLLTKLLYLLNAPLTRLATALQSPLRDLATVLKQLEEKKEKEQPAEAAPPVTEEAVPKASEEEAKPEASEEPESAEPPEGESQAEASEEKAKQETSEEPESAEAPVEEAAPEPETPEAAAAEPEAAEEGTTEEEAVEQQATDQETTE